MFEEFRTRKLSMTSERSMFWEEKVAEPAFPYRDPRLLPFGNRRSRKNGALLVCTWIPERRVADWPGRARFSCVGDTGQCARRTPFASRYFLKTLRELSLGSVACTTTISYGSYLSSRDRHDYVSSTMAP